MGKLFNSTCSLANLRIFKVTLRIGIVVILSSVTYIHFSSDLGFLKGYQGLNNLFLIYKFPISVAAFLSALLAIYGLIHRSEQTRKQLIINEGFKQREYFLKYLQEEVNEVKKYKDKEEVKEKLLVKIDRPYRLYNKLFPSIEAGIFSIDEKFIESINELFSNILNLLKDIETLQGDRTKEDIENKVCQLVHKLEEEFFAEKLGECMTYSANDSQYYLNKDVLLTKRQLAFRAKKVVAIFEVSPIFSVSKEASAIAKATEL